MHIWQHGESRKLTDLNPWLRDHALSSPQSLWYDGVDGAKVHGWLMQPLDFDPARKYPLVLYVHCSMFGWDFNHEFQVYANAGYAVAYFNQRGTTAGYGQAWTKASEGDQGGADYEEIMLGVDELVKLPWLDEARMGVTGGSCGGFMTNWVVGHTDRFAAGVSPAQHHQSNQFLWHQRHWARMHRRRNAHRPLARLARQLAAVAYRLHRQCQYAPADYP